MILFPGLAEPGQHMRRFGRRGEKSVWSWMAGLKKRCHEVAASLENPIVGIAKRLE